jgi:D-aminopeptidase
MRPPPPHTGVPGPDATAGGARPRARELGLAPGRLAPGPCNAITDVAGVRVGHATVRAPGGTSHGPVNTGVTAVLPAAGDVYAERVRAGSFVLNGAGEVAGISQLAEWGTLETPILLTDTMSVGAVSDALSAWVCEQHPEIGRSADVVIPLVGECDSSWLSDVHARPLGAEHVRAALTAALPGAVAEGSVGAGAGMSTCDFAGGIGTASRQVPYAHATYTLGVLVQSNFGSREDLVMDGVPVGRLLEARSEPKRHGYGSIIVLVATDAPLLGAELDRLAKRAALGVAKVGSYAAHGSGEIVVAFSTQNRVPRTKNEALTRVDLLEGRELNPLFQAAVEATEEAILNALCAGSEVQAASDRSCPSLPLAHVEDLLASRHGARFHTIQTAMQGRL